MQVKLTETHNINKETPSFMQTIKNFFSNIIKLKQAQTFSESVAELIKEHSAEGDKISTEEQTLLKNVFTLRELKVCDVMIPRTDIIAVEKSINLDELKQVLIEHEHTRMPVYRDSLDNVIGFIHIKDLFPIIVNEHPFALEEIIRQLLVVSPSMKVIDLLAKMRHSRVHMALVLDEYGGTDGLVTIEDLVEEIVGEIQDEHDDTTEPDLVLLDHDTIEASARLPIFKLEKTLNITFASENSEDFDTIGGLLLSIASYVPVKGEKILYEPENIEFEILESDPRRVKRVLIRRKNKITESNES